MKRILFLLPLFFLSVAFCQQLEPPDKIYGELFRDVQMSRIFPDGKTFVDCIPKRDPKQILADYTAIRNNPAIKFSLKLFVESNFIIPEDKNVEVPKDEDVITHIKSLWKILRRDPDTPVKGSSLLALPYPYIVPGGRFREIYYWDSYFTMLGLRESGEEEMIENMIRNFAYLINEFGHIPNGNRTYYLSRSQPPYFACMVELLAEKKGNSTYAIYLDALEKEYNYWMDKTAKTKHVVKMPDGSILNRYYDQSDKPRQESYYEDYEISKGLPEANRSKMRRDLRSGAESGIDFSSRWFSNSKSLKTIQTTNYIPVDLNSLLYNLELVLSKAHKERGNINRQRYYEQLAERRKKAIIKYCWSPSAGYFVDYNFITKKQSPELILTGMAPMFFEIATKSQGQAVMNTIKKKFLHSGGVATSTKKTGEQWDAPNGWAPLEWLTIRGLENYQHDELAKEISTRWIKLNVDVYKRTGKLMEKYNVMDTNLEAGGGEYKSQDGFGWTNGVLLALIAKYGIGN